MKPYRGTISHWFKVIHVKIPRINNNELGFFVIGRFDDHPKYPGIRGLTSNIVYSEDPFVETEHGVYKLEGGWHDPKKLLLRWRKLFAEPMCVLPRIRTIRPRDDDQYEMHLLRPAPEGLCVPIRWHI